MSRTRSRLWIVTPLMLALVSGCVASTGDFCDIARPMYFNSDGVVDWLGDNDPRLLRDVVIHNEMTTRCP